jgi:threonine-phosphate decarboxylase
MRVPEPITRPAHGGDVAAIARRYGVDPAALVDFSSNADPYGTPARVVSALYALAQSKDELSQYPEPTAQALREAAGERHGIDPASVVVANGATALLDAVVRTTAPGATVVPVPAFSEYRRAVESAGSRFVPYPLNASFDWDDAELLQRIADEKATLLILANPHNPSGLLVPAVRLRMLAEDCARLGTFVIVDEAFIDYAEKESLARSVPENVIVIRSLTKFFGMPGIRIGYAVASAPLAEAIASRLPSWPVGAVDLAAGVAALSRPDLTERSIQTNKRERVRLTRALRRAGITVFAAAANFLLLELPCHESELDAWLERLVREFGLVVRDCRSYDGLEKRSIVRVAVRKVDENTRLIRALTALAGKDAQAAVG